MTFVQTETIYLSKKEYEAFDLVITCLQRMQDHSKNPDMPLITGNLLDSFEDLFVHVCDDTMMEEHQ